MRELTETLKTIMATVSGQLELLPASEGAVEEMTYVDEEERDDTKLSGDHLLVESADGGLKLPRLSKQCREKVAPGISVNDLEEQIDELAAEMWGLSKEELKDIKESLDEMK